MGDVVVFAEVARVRRQRLARAVHLRCREILVVSLDAARTALATSPPGESVVWQRRVRHLEALVTYAEVVG